MDETKEIISPGESTKVGSYVATPTIVDFHADETLQLELVHQNHQNLKKESLKG